MKSKFLAWVSAASAVALVSGILVIAANASIGSSSSMLETDGIDLVSANVDGHDVDYCFDQQIGREPTDAGDFSLYGYDSDDTSDAFGTSVDFDEDDENCVEVSFGAGIEREPNFTAAAVAEDAVETRGDVSNPAGTVDLGGSTAAGGEGITTNPNLVDFEARESADEIIYDLDEEIDCEEIDTTGDDDSNFGYYTSDPGPVQFQGTSIQECDDDTGEVTVGFGAGNVDDVESVFIVDTTNDTNLNTAAAGAICEEDPIGDFGCSELESINGDVEDAPDLTGVERTDDNEWTYSFDSDVDPDAGDIDEALFHLYEEDGFEYTPDTDECNEDEGDTVVCNFDINGDSRASVAGNSEDALDGEFPHAGVEECAVLDETSGDCNPVGADSPSGFEDSGFTDGPDLQRATFDATGETVTFFLDEPHNDDVDPDAGDFYVIDADMRTAQGTDVDDVEVDDNSISVEFDQDDIESAVGAGMDDEAAEDYLGNLSVEAAVGGGPSGTPASPSGSTATTTTTATTATTTTTRSPVTRRIPTTLTGHYGGKAFKGSVGSSRNQCVRGRLVTVKKRGKTIGTDTSSSSGTWKVRKPRAKGRYKAHVARKVFTAANGDRIICLEDDSPSIRVRRRR